jgi:cation diffusion facilitator family transporter
MLTHFSPQPCQLSPFHDTSRTIMSAENPTTHIYKALFANSGIAIGKGIAAVLTGSGAMLAETIHSAADCGNQVLLLVGVKRSQKAPDATHPLGYGRALYFWSFIVALLLFTGGGVASIYEGLHKLKHPEPIENMAVALGVLMFSLLVEGLATLDNVKDLNRKRGAIPFFSYLRQSKDSDLIVIFGENAAATLGLMLALAAILVSHFTENPVWDAVGTLSIGGVLVGVAVFLAVEVKSLLVGESADPEIERCVRELIKERPEIERVLELITLQQGPGEVVVALKASFYPHHTAKEICEAINLLEQALRAKRPDAKWIFVEPDHKP